jgi:KDO2-lipid IV(A) lauroyltransferase
VKSFLGKIIWGVSKFLSLLPRSVHLSLGWLLGFLWFSVFRIRRHVVLDGLRKAYPEKSPDWHKRVGFQSLWNMGNNIVEYLLLVSYSKEQMDRYFVFEGMESLDRAKAKGKGALILTAHMGNGDFGCVGLSSKGYPVAIISKQFKSKWLNEAWFGLRRRLGIKFIREEKSTFEILRALKAGEFVIFVLDQFMGPPSGVETTFFGRKTGTAQGLALFHQRTGVDVIPGYTMRDGEGRLHVIADSPIPFEERSSHEETISFMTQKYTDKIEEIVRKDPGQWLWLHKRWKKFEIR